MSDATVTVWAVKEGSDQVYYGQITVSPDEGFILSVEVCPKITAFWSVTIDLLKPDGTPMFDEFVKSKGHTVSAGHCMRADFPLSFPQSGKIEVIVSYIDDVGNYHKVWTGYFTVNVVKQPSVSLSNSKLYYKGKGYPPSTVVKVSKGDEVYIVSDVSASSPCNLVLELYDEYNDRVICSKSEDVSGTVTVTLDFTADKYSCLVLRAKYNGDIVAVDGPWTVSVTSGGPPPPTPPPPPTVPTKPFTITPLEAAAIGLILGSVIIILLGGRHD